MARFRVFVSNRLEVLVDCLAEAISEPLPSPLDQEHIVVQSKGMERWLSMRLARRFGIWGNCRYPFPNIIIHDLIQSVVPDLPDSTPFEPGILAWRIAKHLPACSLRPGFESLRNYLGGEEENGSPKQGTGSLKQLQLAGRLANVFDQYTMFRPQWIHDWEDGKESHWQARLWRELTNEASGTHAQSGHKAAILRKFQKTISELSPEEPLPGKAPKRLSIFGIPSLPPLHMEVFSAMSRHIEVNLFLMNPCQEYWFDLASEKDVARVHRKISRKFSEKAIPSAGAIDEESPDTLAASEELHYETGHPLLASLGKLGAHFFDSLLDLPFIEEERRFEDPGEGSLLSCLQSDILFLNDRGSGGGKKKMIAPDDDSIQVHVCHSPMREVEVLYDLLLDLFERKPDLEPRDILVMMPDIESYAPYIGAVFESCQDHPGRKIPYSVADRSARREGQLIEVFLKILGLCGSRFGQTQVLDILEAPPVQRRFGLEGEGIASIHRWVKDTRIRWGKDARGRSRFGVPDFPENTWKSGLDRLLLGYALPGGGERMFAEILPYDGIEGDDAAILGRFLEFTNQLFDQATELEQPRLLAGWVQVFQGVMDRFFRLDEADEAQRQVIQKVFQELKEAQDMADFQDRIGIETIRAWLADRLDHEELGTGFLTGGVTFCTMLPMRSIPHRAVALLGMGDGIFPRTARPPGFDLMARAPQRGDPSKRDEDRYLFLEALLSAREHFLISYVGQSIRDNSQIPPSVVVSELMEAIERGFEHPQGKILDRLIITHRLQAFSPAYFQPQGPLFSYCEENFQALCSHAGNGQKAWSVLNRPFINAPLPELPEEKKTLSLSQLARFLANPARFFLINRLGIRLDEAAVSLNEREPFEVSGLDRYLVEQEMVRKRLRGGNLEEHYPVVRAQGILPPRVMGMMAYQDLCTGVAKFTDKVRQHVHGDEMAPVDVDIELAGFRLTGRIGGIWPGGLIRYRCAKIKARDCLEAWIDHLVLNYLEHDGYPRNSLLIASDEQWVFPPVPDSGKILEAILKLYWQGMQLPLPFFPVTSLDYAKRIMDGQAPGEALQKARLVWEGHDFSPGEKEEPYLRLCFGKAADPLDGEFAVVAQDVYGPLLGCVKDSGQWSVGSKDSGQ
ncbi:MAG: exodeoxyribonuclease V subunit gamma [bacterium]